MPKRRELRHEISASPPVIQVQRENDSEDRARPYPEIKEEKTQAKATAMTTVNRFQNASEEVTIYKHSNGTTDIYTRDRQGREFISYFGRNSNFQGTKWVNVGQFKHAELK